MSEPVTGVSLLPTVSYHLSCTLIGVGSLRLRRSEIDMLRTIFPSIPRDVLERTSVAELYKLVPPSQARGMKTRSAKATATLLEAAVKVLQDSRSEHAKTR